MKIFISYNKHNKEYIEGIIQSLSQEGYEIFAENLNIKVGDNWFQKINEGIKDFDAILIVVSQETFNSKHALREIESIILNDISRKETVIVSLTLENTLPPGYLSAYPSIDLSINYTYAINELKLLLKKKLIDKNTTKGKENQYDNERRNEVFITQLSEKLKEGRLTLVCGSGVSIGAKIPSWEKLLFRLMESMLIKISVKRAHLFKNLSIHDFKTRIKSSSLIIGKYLKSTLGKDFLSKLRDAIYQDNPSTCELIEAIVEVSRPQRDGKPLDSIITFNFDGLIEENLNQNNIKHKPIDNEGIRNDPDELPIYHVHGYLPRKGKISKYKEVVFSEDAYHTQFIEPFSWSNLIQLNKLSQNTCLFIGLSLNDPNLRRLLDVANRKEILNNLNHYIIKKIPMTNSDQLIDHLMMFLEEQDANELGLNVIWVKNFEEIPLLIRKMI